MKKGTYKRTPEILLKQSLAQKGKNRVPFTEEHKKKIALSKIGNQNGKGLIGTKKTEEHKLKIKEARKRQTMVRGEKHWKWDGLGTRLERLERIAGRKKSKECEICGAMDVICFDHCHITSKFRGWICRRCNTVLGFVKDNSELLISMSNYLLDNKKIS